MRTSRVCLALCSAVAVLVVTACASVPETSAPISVRKVHAGLALEQGPNVRSVPSPPRRGMGPSEIVQGFLDATSGGDPQHDVARKYLTPRAATSWDDGAGATVYDGNQVYVNPSRDGSRVALSVRRVATVGTDGSYTAEPGRLRLTLSLRKIDGQWRVGSPPPGVFVTSSDFARNYQRVNLYFLGPQHDVVVPDPRYFSVPPGSLANRMVAALLAGPSSWLSPAVRTAVPSGVTLRRNIVQSSPVITVDLSGLGSMTSGQLMGMSAQIVWTLDQLNSDPVQILADGQPLTVPGVGIEQQQSDWQSFDPDALPTSASAYFLADGAVWTQDGRIDGPAGTGAYGLSSVAVGLNRGMLAGVNIRTGSEHLFVGPLGGSLTDRLHATTLTPPTWERDSSAVWTVRDGVDLVSVPVHGAAQVVAAPELARYAPITQLQLSRDGTRVALIGRGRLYVGRVSTQSGTTTVDGLRPAGADLSEATDVSWASATELAALAPNTSSARVPWQIQMDGSAEAAQSTAGLPGPPTAVAAAPEHLTLVSSAGSMWLLADRSWNQLLRNNQLIYAVAPTYPG
jgi:hypothetical protein